MDGHDRVRRAITGARLGRHAPRGRPARRAGQFLGPRFARDVAGLSQQAIELREGLPQTRVGELARLALQESAARRAIIEQCPNPAKERRTV
jgi:hypothetical protein